MTQVVHRAAELQRASSAQRVVVMTMGALHDGHAELIRQARRLAGGGGTVIVTIFVNPTQFAAGEDYIRYPRTLDSDVAIAREAGADIVFAPDVHEIYGPAGGFGPQTVTVDPGRFGDVLEGASRPGHFRGVLTVVAKLLGQTGADVALFGEKDWQQLVLIRAMVADLSLPVEIVGVPTVREPDGLAMSSRNRYLSAADRDAAASLARALRCVTDALASGADEAAALAAGRAALHPDVELDYLVVLDGRVLVAARVGTTRLIDNCAVDDGPRP